MRVGCWTIWFAVVIGFLFEFAVPFFNSDHSKMKEYLNATFWLSLHAATGSGALLFGLFQFLPSSRCRNHWLHYAVGTAYVGCVIPSCMSAFYLAAITPRGSVFALGLSCQSAIWLVATLMACSNVCRRRFRQHSEWILRSYVVTFSFVTFRSTVILMTYAGITTEADRFNIASWIGWSMPLAATEIVIHARRRAENVERNFGPPSNSE